jgi:hypothetical protein
VRLFFVLKGWLTLTAARIRKFSAIQAWDTIVLFRVKRVSSTSELRLSEV